jgi:hypothetical protein
LPNWKRSSRLRLSSGRFRLVRPNNQRCERVGGFVLDFNDNVAGMDDATVTVEVHFTSELPPFAKNVREIDLTRFARSGGCGGSESIRERPALVRGVALPVCFFDSPRWFRQSAKILTGVMKP